jgi:hypothetical protein
LNGEHDGGNSKDRARDRWADSFLYLGAEKVGAVNQLSRVEKWVCTWTAAIVAANVFAAPFPDAFIGSYFALSTALLFSIDVSLNIMLLILKNEGNWWGW